MILSLAFALTFCVLMWPLQARFARRVNPLAATLGAAAGVFCGFAVLGIALLMCGRQARQEAPQYLDSLRLEYSALQNWAAPRGIELPLPLEVRAALGDEIIALRSNAKRNLVFAVALILTCVFFLSQFDVRRLRRSDDSHKTGAARVLVLLFRVAENFHNFLIGRIPKACFAGASTLVFLKFTGVEFSFSWSVLAALLAFIPIFGALLTAAIPALWAWFQFQNASVALLVFIGGVLIQILAHEFQKKNPSFLPTHVEAVGEG